MSRLLPRGARTWVVVGLLAAACAPDATIFTADLHPVKLPGAATVAPSAEATAASAPPFIIPTTTPSPLLSPSAAPASPAATAAASVPPGAVPTATPVPSPVVALVVASQPPDTWLTAPSLHRARAGLIAAALGGDLFAAEGENRASLEWLGDDNSAWTPIEVPPRTTQAFQPIGRRLSALAGDGSRVLGAGGDEGDVLDEVLSYSKEGALLAGRLNSPVMAAAAGLDGNTLVVAGGLDGNRQVTGVVQRLDVQTQLAATGAAMPVPVAGAAYTVLGGKLYVMGGYVFAADGSVTPRIDVQVYDIPTDTWQHAGDGSADAPPSLGLPRHSAAAASLGTRLYVVGGASIGGAALNHISIYDTLTRTWTEGAPMPTARALLGLAAFEGRLWAVGGVGSTGQPLTSVEAYQP